MNPQDRAKFDQMQANIIDIYVMTWSGLYRKLIESGLAPETAEKFVCTYITADVGRPIAATPPPPAKEKDAP